MRIEDVVEFENENTCLDFKSVQYSKSMHEALLKDVIAMANAEAISEERLIICGVKYFSSGTRNIIGIKDAFTDSAILQQLVHENIEPELTIRYDALNCKDVVLGILRIMNCEDQPYMMKKDFKSLRKGDAFVRKGSHQTRLSRSDIDRIISRKVSNDSFNGMIDCNFANSGTKTLIVERRVGITLPSDLQKEKIEKILRKKEEAYKDKLHLPLWAYDQDIQMIGGTPYEYRSTKTLRKNLEDVKDTYKEDDLHYLSTKVAECIAFTLSNESDTYLEDAFIETKIPKTKGLIVFKKIYRKPVDGSFLNPMIPSPASYDELNYPNVIDDEMYYIITDPIGDLKHNIPVFAPAVPVKVLFTGAIEKEEIELHVKIHGKNLKSPRKFALKIIVN